MRELQLGRSLSEPVLAAHATHLAGADAKLTPAERALVPEDHVPDEAHLEQLRRAITGGGDPLGELFCAVRSAKTRRAHGAVYTPRPIVTAMLDWATKQGTPARIVDPGAGSGRFLFAAGKRFPDTQLVAVEIDPLAALTLRANAAVLGLSDRLIVLIQDYRAADLADIKGKTLFLGNPPYVRHHAIAPEWKAWFADIAADHGLKASKLAGLHIHFFLKTHTLAKPGDYGAFITSAEWLDVNYGHVMRELLTTHFGGVALHVIAPVARPFADAMTTGAITCFHAKRTGHAIRFRSVRKLSELGSLPPGRKVRSPIVKSEHRWSRLLQPLARAPHGHLKLGDICRVHRGQVTGCNAVWIAGGFRGQLPESVLFATVTRARELFDAETELSCSDQLRRVVDLPTELNGFDDEESRQIEQFLRWAKGAGADTSYVARNRKAWWSVGLREAAPILATYMARRPPAFVRNKCRAHHLNIAHGIYPRVPMADAVLDALSAWLRDTVCLTDGRSYAGGLTKFEPRELEQLSVPPLEELHERAQDLDTRRTDSRRQPSQGTLSPTTA